MKLLNNEEKWEQKVQVELTLRELQHLYDCVMNIPFCDIQCGGYEVPYDLDFSENVAKELDNIIKNKGGYNYYE